MKGTGKVWLRFMNALEKKKTLASSVASLASSFPPGKYSPHRHFSAPELHPGRVQLNSGAVSVSAAVSL